MDYDVSEEITSLWVSYVDKCMRGEIDVTIFEELTLVHDKEDYVGYNFTIFNYDRFMMFHDGSGYMITFSPPRDSPFEYYAIRSSLDVDQALTDAFSYDRIDSFIRMHRL